MDGYNCIEAVSCYLNETNGLFEFLHDKCFTDCKEGVATTKALSVLHGCHKPAYELLRNYGYICDCLTILQDRVQQAAAMLERITEARLGADRNQCHTVQNLAKLASGSEQTG